jgi:hypothetical protein
MFYPVNPSALCGKDLSPMAQKLPHAIIDLMRRNQVILALFSVAILFSMLREWNAPISCSRTNFPLASLAAPSRP